MTLQFRTNHIASLMAGAAVLWLTAPVFAAGSDDSEPPKKTETTTVCTGDQEGWVWDEELQKCVPPEQQSMNDDEIYRAARELAYAGRYDAAIHVLNLAENQNDPRILNYLGFSNRKAGRLEIGMDYYHRALALKPDYILARSYMGQALIQEGDLAGAYEQLAMIDSYGGKDTWAYRSLFMALNGQPTNY